ncbi:hypothetical protein ACFQS1_32380 [Paractinoplanes rhizophilus]|uniref:Uncharacterized protein n=1 Tax=Paractinoplanes rhizophilus TaxID=1416877 RepID=A0ABW2I1E1_9ACTN
MPTTELVVTIDDPSLRSSLRSWLAADENVPRRLKVAPAQARPGELGAELEIMRMLLEGGGAVTVLIESVALWLQSRRSDVSVELSIGKKKVSVSSGSLRNASTEDLERLVRGIARELEDE